MGRVIFQPAAEADLDEIADYIAEDNIKAAVRFYDAAFEACRRLAEMPGMGAARPSKKAELAGLRTWPIKGFRNYVICYRPSPEGIQVLRILHGMRDLNRILDLE